MKITIVNAHWNNRGDEAAHRPLWIELQKRYPGAKITVLFKDRKPITWFPDMSGIKFHSCQFNTSSSDIWLSVLSRGLFGKDPLLKMQARVLRESDLIVYPPGGSVINDRFFWSKQMEYLVPFLCSRIYGVPMIVCAPSMGPYNQKPRRLLRKWLLSTPRLFCVREDISRQYLETIGVRDNIEVTMDLAFMDDINKHDAEKQLRSYPELQDFLKAYPRIVGMTISDFKWHVKIGKDEELLERTDLSIRKMIASLAAQDYGVLLIPQLFGNQNDYEYLHKFAGKHVYVMSDKPDTYLQQYVISKLYAVIGMRYHSNIFAAKMGIPFIAVVYEEKMEGFLELAKLSDYGLLLQDISFDKLNEKFQALEKHYIALQTQLQQSRSEWRKRARRTVDLLPDIV